LQVECKEVLCTDPFLEADFLTPLEETIERASLLFVGAPHTAYKSLDFGQKPVIDIWNATKNGIRVL
jgi:UDP-N-acetyl-D-mannosaminuronic acid dehydrogenase